MRSQFSEGRDPDIIRQITDAIASVNECRCWMLDPGATTKRAFPPRFRAANEGTTVRVGRLRRDQHPATTLR